jgi:hypothetical protein
VLKWFAQDRQRGRRSDDFAPPYEVVCECGQTMSGVRTARRQIVPCSACGRGVFILPRSSLPSPDAAFAPASPRSALGAWRLPLIGATATLALLLILFVIVLPFLGRPAPPPKTMEGPQDIPARMEAGRRALAEGDFHLASQELGKALDQARRHPDALAPAERRDLVQLERQGDLLSRLSSRSLQDMVQEADLVRHEDEWKARFETDYKGKTVLFDDVVRFEDAVPGDGPRRPVLKYYRVMIGGQEVQRVMIGGQEVRLALEDLTLLQRLAREKPQRMLFGGRLSAVERGPGGRWVIRFEPDSGVLLTDRGAAEAVCPAPLDPELLDVLKRQAEWLSRNESGD